MVAFCLFFLFVLCLCFSFLLIYFYSLSIVFCVPSCTATMTFALMATFLSVVFCLLSLLFSERFLGLNLVWFRLSCDPGWIRSGSVNVRYNSNNTLIKTGSENIEATLCRRWILFAGFGARMENPRLRECEMIGELVRGTGCVGDQEKEWMGCFLDDLRAFGINADQWTIL